MIKVNKEVFEALERVKAKYRHNFKYGLFNSYVGKAFEEEDYILMTLDKVELCSIIANGYEIELTKEEKVLRNYNTHLDLSEISSNEKQKNFSNGYLIGVTNTLRDLDIKIKGINA